MRNMNKLKQGTEIHEAFHRLSLGGDLLRNTHIRKEKIQEKFRDIWNDNSLARVEIYAVCYLLLTEQ